MTIKEMENKARELRSLQALIEEAQAEAESIRLIQEALAKSPDYVDYVKWNKWDGKLPEVMGSDGVLVDVGDLGE